MKRLFLIPLMVLTMCSVGCTSKAVVPTDITTTVTMSSVEQAQDVATKSVISLGEVMFSAPTLLKAARQGGKLTKDEYNTSVEVYNRALASYTLLNQMLQAAITAGKDPRNANSYTEALAKFMLDRNLLKNIVTTLGGV